MKVAAITNFETLTENAKAILDDWGSERGPKGNLLRPWVSPSDPLYKKANRAYELAIADLDTASPSIGDILDSIDLYMGVDRSGSFWDVPDIEYESRQPAGDFF